MKKQVTKIELNGKIIGTKPLLNDDTLSSIREKIREKVSVPYQFIDKSGNLISKENEQHYTLESIIEDKLIKIKSDLSNQAGINILFNNKIIGSDNYDKSTSLEELRSLLKNKINCEFSFLDQSGNYIEKIDETDYSIEDILDDNTIKLKGNNQLEQFINIKDTRNKSKMKKFDLSKYRLLNESENGMSIYKYSLKDKISNYKDVYQYYYDDFTFLDDHNAYVVLFCGKTGDGKSTAINAFFNIIKGIEINDPYRFILVDEPEKEKGQAESQTDGLHLYYIKDYENKPVIIIDSQGYGDTRGLEKDQSLIEVFKYIFSNVIDHINTALFIVNSSTNRIDVSTKYIFSSVTSLFSEDISENFIVLGTFCNYDIINNKCPTFVKSIQNQEDFLKINKNDKWWYAMDSKSIFYNKINELSIYSFENAIELYENRIKKLRPKSIKQCAEVLINRIELNIQRKNLYNKFEKLIYDQGNLENEKENADNATKNLEEVEKKIKNCEDIENPEEFLKKVSQANKEIKKIFDELNKPVQKKVITLAYWGDSKCTHCRVCKKNCHETCNCFFSTLFHRCKVFSFFGKRCEECGCDKEYHEQDHYYYKWVTVDDIENSEPELKKKKEDLEKLNKIKEEKKKFIQYKFELIKKKDEIDKEKDKIMNNINENMIQIFVTITSLQNITEKLEKIAMNSAHLRNEEDYIDDCLKKMDSANLKENEKIEKMKNIKKYNDIYRKALKLNQEELSKLDASQLTEKLKKVLG